MLCKRPLFWQRLHQHMHSIYKANGLPEDLGKRLCQASGRQEQHHLIWHVRWLYGLQGSASCGLSGSGPQASRPASWLALHYLASPSAARDRLQSHSYSPAAAIWQCFGSSLKFKTQDLNTRQYSGHPQCMCLILGEETCRTHNRWMSALKLQHCTVKNQVASYITSKSLYPTHSTSRFGKTSNA